MKNKAAPCSTQSTFSSAAEPARELGHQHDQHAVHTFICISFSRFSLMAALLSSAGSFLRRGEWAKLDISRQRTEK
jgi:hypothetical protein